MSEENKSVKAIVAEKLIKLGQSLLETNEEKKPLEMMAEGILTDGSKIVTPADAWVEGVEIFVETEQGALPLAPGEYTLQDGTVIVVEQEGILNEIRPVVEEPAEVEIEIEAEKKEKNTMDEQKVKAIVETLVKEYKFSAIEELKKENSELKDSVVMLSEAIQELSKPYEAKKNEPAKVERKINMSAVAKLDGEARLAAIREKYNNN
jgi:Mg2+ and Co2+ transporter CorA